MTASRAELLPWPRFNGFAYDSLRVRIRGRS
ncbi:MAG: hypothetical protein JWR86_598 [Enterovirga sp.]|jgi:hypothetical protein|nr:hypothetical protein [Enterovirga sp.]